MTEVPCNGCVRCCANDVIRELDDEDAKWFLTVAHPTKPGQRILARRPGGGCYYLMESGCSVHASKPRMCQEFDCREIATKLSFTLARRGGYAPVWFKGRELLKKQL